MNGRVKHAQERMAVIDEEDDEVELCFFFFFFLGICGPVPFFQYKIILNEKRCRLNKGIFGKFEPKDAHAAHVV
jgi:hypothetical protein